MNLILDTHALIWFTEDDKRLSAYAKELILQPQYQKIVPYITLCEIHYLNIHGRCFTSAQSIRQLLEDAVDFEIADHTIDQLDYLLPELDIHDGLIVATALAYQANGYSEIEIISKDKLIHTHSPIPVRWQRPHQA